jgi:ribokinase
MKVINIGSCNIDYTYSVDHFLQPGETSNCLKLTTGCGGKGLNQSIALAQAGLTTYHAGLIGEDGTFLKDKLMQMCVNTEFVNTMPSRTGHAIIQLDKTGQNCILLYQGTNHLFTKSYVDEVLSHFKKGDIVILQNEINNIPYIIDKASSLGLRIAFNAAPFTDDIFSYPLDKLEWLIVNEIEGACLSKKNDYAQIIEELRHCLPNTNILLTMGKNGSIYATPEGITQANACVVNAVDTTAAGDTFTGFFIRGIVDNLSINETLKIASISSAIAVTRPGAADSIPSYDEVIQSDLYKKIVS